MRKTYKLVTVLGTVPAIYEDFKEQADLDELDEAVYAIDKEANFVVANLRDGVACKAIPRVITLLPFRHDMLVPPDQIRDAVGKNDVQGQMSSRGFVLDGKASLIDAAKRFNTLSSGAVNPMILSWILSADFDTLADAFLADGDSVEDVTDPVIKTLLRR